MLEKDIEKYLVSEVKKLNGVCLKLNSQSANGVPDRLVLFKNQTSIFVELKKPGKRLRPLQVYWKNGLTELGFKSIKIDCKDDVDKLIEEARDEICTT